MNAIYALRCPETNAIRYIGKTNNPQKRLMDHIREARESAVDYYRLRWIRTLLARGCQPSMSVLCRLTQDMNWSGVEMFFIATAKHFGLRLVNSTDGGEGSTNPCIETRNRMSESRKRAWATDEGRAKYMARLSDDEHMQRLGASIRRGKDNEACKKRASEHSRELWSRPGMKELKAKNAQIGWTTCDREKRCAAIGSARRASWARLKAAAANGDAEAIEKLARVSARASESGRRPRAPLSAEAKTRQQSGLIRFRAAQRLETIRRRMEWDCL